MSARITRVAGVSVAGLVLSGVAPGALAAVNTINWMTYAPVLYGNQPPSNFGYTLPGVGLVNVTYTSNPAFTTARLDQTTSLGNGSLVYGPDTYQWGNYESFARVHAAQSPLNIPWSITSTFPSTVSAGEIVLGVSGLGRRDPNPGENAADCITTCSVLQNGTFFGDYGSGNWGPTNFVGAAGSFTMTNSVSGAGGADPWWNTPLAVTRIDDVMNALTVNFTQTSGDGIGVNIGVIVPSPGAAAFAPVCALAALRRRRRA